jgi:hypothetical protein
MKAVAWPLSSSTGSPWWAQPPGSRWTSPPAGALRWRWRREATDPGRPRPDLVASATWRRVFDVWCEGRTVDDGNDIWRRSRAATEVVGCGCGGLALAAASTTTDAASGVARVFGCRVRAGALARRAPSSRDAVVVPDLSHLQLVWRPARICALCRAGWRLRPRAAGGRLLRASMVTAVAAAGAGRRSAWLVGGGLGRPQPGCPASPPFFACVAGSASPRW